MPSCLVLHMDKFRREAVRGIQSHNQRERKSRSNPDIVAGKSNLNYDLYNDGRVNFQKVIDDRVDNLNLKRAPRHDAVFMCGLIVSSNLEFFQNMDAVEQKRFFQSAKDWLEDFVGPDNVIAANVHMDEKTPHLHFTHVPVTPDGRLNICKALVLKSGVESFRNPVQLKSILIRENLNSSKLLWKN